MGMHISANCIQSSKMHRFFAILFVLILRLQQYNFNSFQLKCIFNTMIKNIFHRINFEYFKYARFDINVKCLKFKNVWMWVKCFGQLTIALEIIACDKKYLSCLYSLDFICIFYELEPVQTNFTFIMIKGWRVLICKSTKLNHYRPDIIELNSVPLLRWLFESVCHAFCIQNIWGIWSRRFQCDDHHMLQGQLQENFSQFEAYKFSEQLKKLFDII